MSAPEPSWMTMTDVEFEDFHHHAPSNQSIVMHRRLCRGLRDVLATVPPDDLLKRKPLVLNFYAPLPPRLRFYLYGATQHSSERQVGTFKVQLTSGEPAGDDSARFHFDRTNSTRPMLAGYAADLELFILWDADLHDVADGFSYSKNVQAPPEVVWNALTRGMSEGSRLLRGTGAEESIVACRPSHLAAGVKRRIELSNAALLGVG